MAAQPLPPLITLEDHFLTGEAPPDLAEQIELVYDQIYPDSVPFEERLRDAGPLRLQAMDSGDASLQIVSHTPGLSTATLEDCEKANDILHACVKEEESRAGGGDGLRRFAGFAALPTAKPEAAAKELQRCIKDLGFVGALIDTHADGKFYDGSEHDPFWAAAESMNVPIYIHPTWPDEAIMNARYEGGLLSRTAQLTMASSGWGWHSDTAIHVLRLFASGVFDRFPKLKIIIGHMGEKIPFMLERVIDISTWWADRKRNFKLVWDENIWLTTSGNWSVDPMACLLRNTRKDRIMYSVDYPFATFEGTFVLLMMPTYSVI